MFCIDVDTLEAYFAFDPKRKADLRRLDALISKAAPGRAVAFARRRASLAVPAASKSKSSRDPSRGRNLDGTARSSAPTQLRVHSSVPSHS